VPRLRTLRLRLCLLVAGLFRWRLVHFDALQAAAGEQESHDLLDVVALDLD
jgi:hypothetical protein